MRYLRYGKSSQKVVICSSLSFPNVNSNKSTIIKTTKLTLVQHYLLNYTTHFIPTPLVFPQCSVLFFIQRPNPCASSIQPEVQSWKEVRQFDLVVRKTLIQSYSAGNAPILMLSELQKIYILKMFDWVGLIQLNS